MRQLKNLPVYLGVAIASFGYQAQAQQDIAENIGSLSVEEIIVTARKTEESIQDIPFAIQALTDQQIADRDVRGLADIARSTTGFTFENFASAGATANIVVRGVAQTAATARIQNVSVFLNGIYLQRQGMINSGLLDVQRVEILKGPQSALFGRNAFSGAVNYITSEPSDIFAGKVNTTVGSDERFDVGGSITGPIIEDKVLGKFAYSSSEFDGATENDHIYAGLDTPGHNTEDNLGGWENEAFSTALQFLINDSVTLNTSWYHTDLAGEYNPYYTIRGARYAQVGLSASGCVNDVGCTGPLLGSPAFNANLYQGHSQNNGLNANTTSLDGANPFFTPGYSGPILYDGTGNTLWNGKLPYQAPGSEGFLVDPRSSGTLSKTDLATLRLDWEINDDWSSYYLYGYADNSTITKGGADGYGGAWFFDTQVSGFTFNRVKLQAWNGTPNADLTSDSHEVRFEWGGNDLVSASFGLFYSDVNDSDYSLFSYTTFCGPGPGDEEQEILDCMTSTALGTPATLSQQGGSWNLAYQSGKKSGLVAFNDKIYSGFATLNFTLHDDVILVLEGRYTQEDKSVERISDTNGLREGESIPNPNWIPGFVPTINTFENSYANRGIPTSDSDTYYFFAPRTSINWQVTADNMVYFTVAKGEKTGGFNSSASVPTFDPETNWTYELGSKNTFLDNTVVLNGSLYYLDWKDIQGPGSIVDSNTGGVSSPFTATPTDNIGNAEVLGLEVDGVWNVTENWSVDAGFALIDPEYKDTIFADAVNDPVNGIFGGFQCNGTYCDASGDVSGNQVARTSKEQYFGGLNYRTVILDGWGLSSRLSVAYQSKQYAEPINSAYLPSRSTWDANVTLQAPNNWEINFWGKNIFDKEYSSGAIAVAQFNQYVVNAGQARTYGATLTYNFE